jgi:hypothetical protein
MSDDELVKLAQVTAGDARGSDVIILVALSLALAAFCVWLLVRIVNRRERWAKRTAVGGIASLPLFYLLSFGPACWWFSPPTMVQTSGTIIERGVRAPSFFWPVGWLVMHCPSRLSSAINWYATLRTPIVHVVANPAETVVIILSVEPDPIRRRMNRGDRLVF